MVFPSTLSRFELLPPEMLLEIMRLLSPRDLFHLAKISMSFRRILKGCDSGFLWHDAFQSASFRLPSNSEKGLLYANMIYQPQCKFCKRPDAGVVSLFLNLLCCQDCWDEHFIMDEDLPLHVDASMLAVVQSLVVPIRRTKIEVHSRSDRQLELKISLNEKTSCFHSRRTIQRIVDRLRTTIMWTATMNAYVVERHKKLQPIHKREGGASGAGLLTMEADMRMHRVHARYQEIRDTFEDTGYGKDMNCSFITPPDQLAAWGNVVYFPVCTAMQNAVLSGNPWTAFKEALQTSLDYVRSLRQSQLETLVRKRRDLQSKELAMICHVARLEDVCAEELDYVMGPDEVYAHSQVQAVLKRIVEADIASVDLSRVEVEDLSDDVLAIDNEQVDDSYKISPSCMRSLSEELGPVMQCLLALNNSKTARIEEMKTRRKHLALNCLPVIPTAPSWSDHVDERLVMDGLEVGLQFKCNMLDWEGRELVDFVERFCYAVDQEGGDRGIVDYDADGNVAKDDGDGPSEDNDSADGTEGVDGQDYKGGEKLTGYSNADRTSEDVQGGEVEINQRGEGNDNESESEGGEDLKHSMNKLKLLNSHFADITFEDNKDGEVGEGGKDTQDGDDLSYLHVGGSSLESFQDSETSEEFDYLVTDQEQVIDLVELYQSLDAPSMRFRCYGCGMHDLPTSDTLVHRCFIRQWIHPETNLTHNMYAAWNTAPGGYSLLGTQQCLAYDPLSRSEALRRENM